MNESVEMNIEKADYGTIVIFGTLKDLQEKMRLSHASVSDLVNWRRDCDGASLLEVSLAHRKFEISKYLLDNNADVNVVTADGYNEFHFLAPNINLNEAITVGKLLLGKNVSVMQKDAKYGNTAFFSLCLESFKGRSPAVMEFIQECLRKVTSVDETNKAGFSIRSLINERGNKQLKEQLKVVPLE